MKTQSSLLPLLQLAILLFLLGEESNSLLLSYPTTIATHKPTLISSSLYYNKAFHSEDKGQSSIHGQDRMEIVRKLQSLYYQNETSGITEKDHFGVYDNMPILRSTRVELPGFQSLYNVTDPLEIHMFLKVIHDSSSKYFGHIYMSNHYSSRELQDFTSFSPSSSSIEATTASTTSSGDDPEQPHEMSAEEAYRLQLQQQAERDFYSRDRYKVGTLMQVSDVHQDKKTGHLLVLVQALARFVVVEGSMERWDWCSLENLRPYTKEEIILKSKAGYKPTVQRASVELLPDEEFVQYFTQKAKQTMREYDFSLNQDVQGAACAGAIAEASEWRFFETQPQRIPLPGHFLDPVATLSKPDGQLLSIQETVQRTMQEYLSQSPMEMHHGECSLYHADGEEDTDTSLSNDDDDTLKSLLKQQHVLEVERSVWLELDQLCKNLRCLNPRGNANMPIPNQVLSLIPPGNMDWPEDFGLALYTRQLVRAHGVLARNKYKFSNGFQLVPKDYPPLRRARRLSYILWNVFQEQDTMDVPSGEMQRVLEIHSIAKRLESGLLQLQTINRILQTLIRG